MNMNVDQPGHQRFARRVDRLRLQRLRIRSGAGENLCDFSVLHQHRALFDHVSVAQKQACVANQHGAVAAISRASISLSRRCLFEYACHAPIARNGASTTTSQNFAEPRIFSSFSQRNSFTRQERPHHRGQQQRSRRAPDCRQIVSWPSRIAVQSRRQIGRRNELRDHLQPVRHHRDRERRAAQKQHRKIQQSG